MRKWEDMVKSLNKELTIKGGNDNNELTSVVYDEFKKFFTHTNSLKRVLEQGMFIYDYMFYAKNFKDSIFEEILLTLVSCFNDAKKISRTKSKELINEWQSNISIGSKNLSEICWLEEDKSKIKRLDIYTKICFRELGDIIEGTIKHYIKFFYGCYLINSENDIDVLDTINNISLGVCISNLSKYNKDFEIIYKHCFLGINLNQWRNISNHNSYVSDEKVDRIKVTYGINNKKELEIGREQLAQILITTNAINYLHKIAYTIILADNLDMMKIDTKKLRFSNDTIVAQIIESSLAFGFKMKNFKKKENEWIFELIYNKQVLEQNDTNIKKLVSIINNFVENDTIIFISSINDKIRVELKLTKKFSESKDIICGWRYI